MSRTRLVAGNWKMHGSREANRALLDAIVAGVGNAAAQCVVCPPFPYLAQAAERLRGTAVALGAQNVSEHKPGAFTGEVAAGMLVELGCRYAIVGHSERRQLYAESDAQVGAKYSAARAAGLTPILCVGETLAQREAGRTEEVVARQLAAVKFDGGVLAYEPVWAIGTGRNATPEQAQEVHAFLRRQLPTELGRSTPILYGGSVKPQNATAIFAMPDVDGGLIGGASLVAGDFLAIVHAAETHGR